MLKRFNSQLNAKGAVKSAIAFALLASALGLSVPLVWAGAFELSDRVTFNAAAKKACVFNFPKDYTIGRISAASRPGQMAERGLNSPARGLVSMPAGKYVTFEPSRRFYEKPDLVSCLPPIGVDCLVLTASSMDDSEDGMCDRALAHLGRLKSVIKLDLNRSDASDKGAVFARDLPELQEITAFAAMIEGSCFADFARLKKLSVLVLQDDPVKEENLKFLPAISHLEALAIGGTGIGDVGVRNLVGCNQLVFLDLGGNKRITDRSVASLALLKNLRGLTLIGTAITYNGLLQLKGLALTEIRLPAKIYTKDQLKNLQKLFPKALLEVPGSGVQAVNADTRAMYAPLH